MGITNASRAARVVLLATLLFGAVAAPAQAAFPGENGKIAYTRFYWEDDADSYSVCTVNPDGSDQNCTWRYGYTLYPAWSGNGQRLLSEGPLPSVGTMDPDLSNGMLVRDNACCASWSPHAIGKIVLSANESPGLSTVNADGTGFAPLTTDPTTGWGDWSPDGSRIAFHSLRDGNYEIYVIVFATGEEQRLTNTPGHEVAPDWSPDGSRILFGANGQLHTMRADGTDRTPLPLSGFPGSWSPDGQKLVYERSEEIYTANADGTGQTLVPTDAWYCCEDSSTPDWQPLPVNTPSTHVRPAGASPLRISLVPAFNTCAALNRTHGPPLAFGSCNPPVPGSPNLTVGVGDGSPALSRSVGHVRMVVHPGVPGGVDDTDVGIRFSLSNVMNVSDLSEYTGELRASAQMRLTDREGSVAQTTVGFPMEFDVPCVGTAPTIDKSLCELTTTLDAVRPGAAAEGTRAVSALDQVKVYDGGPDGDADTTADNSLFAVQGVFVP